MAAALSDLTQLWDGYSEELTSKDGRCTVSYQCDWSVRSELATVLIGAAHSDYAEMTCTGVQIEPISPSDVVGGPQYAHMTATFLDEATALSKFPQPNSDFSDYWSTEWDFTNEAVTLGGSGWVWSDTGKVLAEDSVSAIKLMPSAAVNVSGQWTSYISKTRIAATIGHVNENAWYGFPAETLLFNNLRLSKKSHLGTPTWAITYSFLWKPDGWNKIYRKTDDPPAFKTVISSDGTSYPYASVPFSDLEPYTW